MISTIALLTDFGWRDPYAGTMKAVMAARCDARILDLSHDIAAGDALEGALFLEATAPYLGPGTVVVAVVDPGVGSGRAIVAGRSGEVIFLAPDNGLLSLVPIDRFVRVENSSLFLPGPGATFHGRDRFAPVAAALASGMDFEALGPPAEEVVTLRYRRPVYGESRAVGSVLSVDRFGNVITDLEAGRLMLDRPLTARIGSEIVNRLASHYQEIPEGLFLIVGSRGTIEVSAFSRSAAEQLHSARFDRVEIVWT